jgi:nitrogen regulatory protein PII
MAETTYKDKIKGKEYYDPQSGRGWEDINAVREGNREAIRVITRRQRMERHEKRDEIIKKATIAAIGVIAAAGIGSSVSHLGQVNKDQAAANEFLNREKAEQVIKNDYPVDQVFDGEITIEKGVNFRTSPTTGDPEDDPSNIVPIENIIAINDVSINEADGVIIKDAMGVFGKQVDGYNPASTNGNWVMLTGKTKTGLKNLFVSVSEQTKKYVHTVGRWLPIKKDNNGIIFAQDGEVNIPKPDMNITTPYSIPK